jgi:membrane protein YqaA with SNARE-associated domain
VREEILLFASSLLAATLFPAQSEIVLAGLHLTQRHDAVVLVAIATAGNVLGACINFVLGRYALVFQERKWFPLTPARLQKTTALYQRFGIWTLFFSWLPIIGDPLTLVAGFFRVNFWLFLGCVTCGKLARYAAIVALL